MLTACWDADEAMDATPSDELLRMNVSEVVLTAADTRGEIYVEASGQWTATTPNDWLTLSPAQGSGMGSLILTTTVNESADGRVGTVILTTSGGISRTIGVRQLGSALSINVSPLTMTIPAIGTQYSLTITSNARWSISTSESWLTGFSATSGSGDANLTFTCQDNTTLVTRTGTITVKSNNGQLSKVISVEQAAGELPVVGALQWITNDETSATLTCLALSSMFAVTEYGICYAETEMPTTADNKHIAGSGIPDDCTFTATITGLTKGATYHARAYAISAAGITYGSPLSFVALSMPGNNDNNRPSFVKKNSKY